MIIKQEKVIELISKFNINVTDIAEIEEFLNDLRCSSVINMFGAPNYVADKFGYTKRLSRQLVIAWMHGDKDNGNLHK